MMLDFLPFEIQSFGAWIVMAIAAIAILVVVLKVVSKVVSTSLRVAIILGSLAVIAAALYVLSTLLNQGIGSVP